MRPPPRFPSQDDIRRARSLFAEAGFTVAGVLEATGVRGMGQLTESHRDVLIERTSGGSAREGLIRLFLLDQDLDAADWLPVDAWTGAGLLEHAAGRVRATVRMLPFDDLLLAFDLPAHAREPDYVMGVGASTLTLAGLTVRRPARAALDLGTGCGIHALLAARHAQEVIATDRSPRAVAFAAFNAALNGLDNVRCAEGDLFAPVEGRRFDLVVTNPPFVISPESHLVYRDSGLDGDAIVRTIVREVPARLEEGGYGQIICNWSHLRGEDWQQRLAGWFEGTGCDAWVLCMETRDAATYADTWIRHTERRRDAALFRRWVDFYAAQGIEAMSAGVITMRRRSGPNWVRIEPAAPRVVGPGGDAVERAFARRDFLERHAGDADLLDARLRASPDLRLVQECAPAPDGWQVVEGRLALARGLAFGGPADPVVAGLIAACNGARTVREVLGTVPEGLRAQALPLVRHLVEQGMLLPASGEPPGKENGT